MTLVVLLDYAAVFVFALTGALVASRAQLDIVGFVFLACLTATGGGTLRDLILDRDPVFWVREPGILMTATVAAVLIFFTAHLAESRYRWLLWLDAVALSVAVPAGVGVALDTGQSAAIVILMGVMTGTFGGMLRDVVANEVPLVLKQGELYLTAAFAGSGAALAALWLGADKSLALLVAAGVTFGLRAGSMWFGWKLPVYKSRPPRV
jgi:uncharacterized membrane protein YeiH